MTTTTEVKANGQAGPKDAAALPPEYEPPDVTGLNLFQRLVLVKKAIGKVGKTAKAPAEMGGFNYVPWEGVADRVGDLLADHGVIALPSMPEYGVDQTADKVGSKQKTNYRTTVKLSYTLINADEPNERHEMIWWGVGDDTSDKGLQKAGTNGTKYLLMKAFMLGGMGGADDSDATAPDHDSESSSVDYGPCGRAGCTGKVARKNRQGGADFAVCSTATYDRATKKRGGCAWKDWEPNWEQYEHRQPSPEAGEGSGNAPSIPPPASLSGQRLVLLNLIGADQTLASGNGWTAADGPWSNWVKTLTDDRVDQIIAHSDIPA